MVSLRERDSMGTKRGQRARDPGPTELSPSSGPVLLPELVRVAFAALVLTAAFTHPLQFTPSPTPNRFRHLDPKLVLPSPIQVHANNARTSG